MQWMFFISALLSKHLLVPSITLLDFYRILIPPSIGFYCKKLSWFGRINKEMLKNKLKKNKPENLSSICKEVCLILCSWDWLHKSVPALHLLQHKPRCTELRTNLNVEQVQLNTTWERGTEGAKLGAATEGMWPTPVTRMASAWCYAEETLKWLPTRQLQAVVPKAVAAGRKREVPRSWWCSLAIPAVHTLWDSMLQQIQT